MSSPIIDGGNASTVYGTTSTTTTGPVFAPDITTYATRTPYITAAEFTEAGTGVDVSQLVPADASTTDQAAALTRVIARASADADTMCHKVLAATQDTQAGRYMVRDGVCRVPVKFSPVIEVTAISTGCNGWDLTPMTDLSRVAITPPKVVEFCAPGWWATGKLFVALTYVNGWACTTLSAAAVQGATSLSLTSNLGVYPGLVLTVDDGGLTEQVTVSDGYVPGASGPVPLAAATTAAHAKGVAASAIPQDVKDAVIRLTAHKIKTRGNEAFMMQGLAGGEPAVTSTGAGGSEDLAEAQRLLAPYRRAA